MAVTTLPSENLPNCSIERALVVLGERWTFLILRQSLMYGQTRFADIQRSLGVASNVLTDRLDSLVSSGLLEKRPYRDGGSRTRFSYHPTRAGIDLKLVLGALQQWGDEYAPRPGGPTVVREVVGTWTGDAPESTQFARVAFVAEDARVLSVDDVRFTRGPGWAPAGNPVE